MTLKRGFTVVLAGAGILWLGLLPGAQGGEKFTARLSMVPIDVSMQANVAGSGSVTADLAGRKLTVAGTFEGLRSPATIAQLHLSHNMGVRGPVLADLTVTKATSGTLSGSVQLTSTQVDNLKRNRIYVQIHSDKAPDGNLWGWLMSQERRQ